jgi:hypothetical protein
LDRAQLHQKLVQAHLFLNKMIERERQLIGEPFSSHLSAFLSAGMSVRDGFFYRPRVFFSISRQFGRGVWRLSVISGPGSSLSAQPELWPRRDARCWQLTDDGNVEITGRELREKSPTSGVPHTLLARLSAWDSPEKP